MRVPPRLKSWLPLLWLGIIALAIRVFSRDPSMVEQYYVRGIYPWISALQRMLFGWLPFSVGDLFYASFLWWALRSVWIFFRRWRNRTLPRPRLLEQGCRRLIMTVLAIYISFNLLWGLHYNRMPMSAALQLEILDYSNEELRSLTSLLAREMNRWQPGAAAARGKLASHRNLFAGARLAYGALSDEDPGFTYRFPSIKASLFSYPGNILGFTGYYNPFTGEAQVNTTVPLLIQPFTACHEIGHQLGYAKESEANFAGFLAAIHSPDPAFRYAAYFDMYAYASRYLYVADSLAWREVRGSLSPACRADQEEVDGFFRRHANLIGTVIDRLYGQYLKANEQPAGRLSYHEVVAYLIAWYQQRGEI